MIHSGQIAQALEAPPESGHTGRTVVGAPVVAAQPGDPVHGLRQGGGVGGNGVVWWMWQ